MTIEELYGLYSRRLVGLAYLLTGDHDIAEDVAGIVWLKAVRRAPLLNDATHGWAWLAKTARWTVIDEWRARKATVDIAAIAYRLVAPDNPERAYLHRERCDAAARLLGKLPLRQATALLLAADGASTVEQAITCSVSEVNARVKLLRARQQVARLHHTEAESGEDASP